MIRWSLTVFFFAFVSPDLATSAEPTLPVTPSTTPATAPVTTPVSGTLPAPISPSKEPAAISNKTLVVSIRTQTNVCTTPGPACTIDTFLVAKAKDNGELVWERRLYFRPYEPTKELAAQIIEVKSLKFLGPKMIQVKNAKGDTFNVEAGHGHMKKPKETKEYAK